MPKKEATPVIPMRVLKVNTFPSLSGRSQLTGHIGCNAEGNIHFRIVANTGSGQFNADWVSLEAIEKLLAAHPADKPMTSRVMLPVFRSKSSNSPAFLFAALMAEGLVKVGTEKDSGYLLGDIEALRKSVSALIASDTNLATVVTASPEVTKRKRKEAAE